MNTENEVKLIIAETLYPSCEINLDSNIRDDLGADSVEEVEILLTIEEGFDIEISDDEAEKVKTVGDAVELVQKMLDMKK